MDLLFGDDVRRRLLTPSESLNRFGASAVYTAVLGQPSSARLPASVIFTRSTLRRSPSVLNVSVTTVASPASTSIASRHLKTTVESAGEEQRGRKVNIYAGAFVIASLVGVVVT
jgi:hypothetical protein